MATWPTSAARSTRMGGTRRSRSSSSGSRKVPNPTRQAPRGRLDVDRSLWLLSFLKFKGWVRRAWRSLKTVKGLILGLVGSLVFMPMVISSLLTPPIGGDSEIEMFRRYGPVLLLVYCMLNLLLSTGERVLYFSPPEIDFLFSGPFRRRQLLLYRFFGTLAAALLTSMVLTLVSVRHSFLPIAAFTGILLSIE